jgi:hypothetical protein
VNTVVMFLVCEQRNCSFGCFKRWLEAAALTGSKGERNDVNTGEMM